MEVLGLQMSRATCDQFRSQFEKSSFGTRSFIKGVDLALIYKFGNLVEL